MDASKVFQVIELPTPENGFEVAVAEVGTWEINSRMKEGFAPYAFVSVPKVDDGQLFHVAWAILKRSEACGLKLAAQRERDLAAKHEAELKKLKLKVECQAERIRDLETLSEGTNG